RIHTSAGPPETLVAQHLQQKIYIVADFRNGVAKLGDLAARVEDRRVIPAAEITADFGQRKLRELLGQRHGDVARASDRAGELLGVHVRDTDLVVVGDGVLDVVDRDLARLLREEV